MDDTPDEPAGNLSAFGISGMYQVTVRMIGGETMVDAAGVALLFGVPEASVRALGEGQSLPEIWVAAGKRRADEARRHGYHEVMDELQFWLARDYPGSHLVVKVLD
jgi:hypothetical protein